MSAYNTIGGMASGAALAMGVDSAGGVGMIAAAKVSITATSGGHDGGVGKRMTLIIPRMALKVLIVVQQRQ